MSRLAVVAVVSFAFSLVAPPTPSQAGPAAGADALAWMSTGVGIFSVDADARTVRYRSCDVDTGRVSDPGMRTAGGVATGQVTVDGTAYRYRIPLEGRTRGLLRIHRPHRPVEVLTGEVVTNPQPPTDPERAARFEPLTERLQEIVDESPNPAGVVVRDLSGRFGDQQVGVNGTFRPKAASVIKLWVLTELLRRVDCGQASLTDGVLVVPADVVDGTGELQHETFPQTVTLFRLAEYMIKFSDNTATNVLINYLGGFAPVNALIDSMNQRQTVLARKMLDTEAAKRGEENYLSADDVVSLLGAVWDGEVLSAPSRELMIHFMLEQTINTKIPAALPSGVPVAHKTGELPDASHDVGYYLIPGTEVAVAFVTSGPQSTGDETVRRLARAVYDYLMNPPPDGTLPITGAGRGALLSAVMGAAAVVLGVALLAVANRRGRRRVTGWRAGRGFSAPLWRVTASRPRPRPARPWRDRDGSVPGASAADG